MNNYFQLPLLEHRHAILRFFCRILKIFQTLRVANILSKRQGVALKLWIEMIKCRANENQLRCSSALNELLWSGWLYNYAVNIEVAATEKRSSGKSNKMKLHWQKKMIRFKLINDHPRNEESQSKLHIWQELSSQSHDRCLSFNLRNCEWEVARRTFPCLQAMSRSEKEESLWATALCKCKKTFGRIRESEFLSPSFFVVSERRMNYLCKLSAEHVWRRHKR